MTGARGGTFDVPRTMLFEEGDLVVDAHSGDQGDNDTGIQYRLAESAELNIERLTQELLVREAATAPSASNSTRDTVYHSLRNCDEKASAHRVSSNGQKWPRDYAPRIFP